MNSKTFDIIVAGGGIAGSMAAISAARNGTSVLLIEEEGYLGGSLTASGTGPMMTFHAGEKQVIRGLTDELVQRLVAKGLSVGHIPDSTGYTYTVTPFDSEGMKRELDLMTQEAGVTVLFHTSIASVTVENGLLVSLTCLSCGTLFPVSAKYFIDATGDADLIAMAKVPFEQGRTTDGRDQPMTANFKLVDVDLAVIRDLMDSKVELFPLLSKKPGLQKQASRLSFSGFEEIMKEGCKTGEISFDRDIVLCFETNASNEVIVNMTRINGKNPVDPFSLSEAEVEGRRQVWELYAFMKKHLPGFSQARMISTGPRIGIRSSRRLKGMYQITVEDMFLQRRFEDAISANGYPLDIHSPDGAATDSRFFPNGAYYTIPLRCLLNDTIPNLLAAGRNISSEFEAHSSLRLSPSCGAIGHAAGTAVALALQNGVDVRYLPSAVLHKRLLEEGAFLG
ncbi:FAD-dependent oxidoreductase [uncultured Sphaerochaeta sp.]|uniref:FAD-dependent oxidoreductase n=1 Tax=uncultured Sphaerochaeta sp. TaxID=886478 RepID=UPI002A0A5087|nr:FAD-dependent oxidoreductase [uncultured Sphaerochaeta sp.]